MQWSEEDISIIFGVLQGNLQEKPDHTSPGVASIPEVKGNFFFVCSYVRMNCNLVDLSML